VDTISQPGFSKTVVNAGPSKKKEELSEEEREARTKEFFKKNEKSLKQYGMFQKYEDSKRFLQEHPELVCEETANYLVIQCINYEMEEKHELMAHVAHQCICMQFMLELAKQLDIDPRACIGSFFTR
jgi:cell division cycle protein 37